MKLNSNLLIVDTSAWIEFFRLQGSAEMREQVTSLVLEGRAAWCEMIRLELWNGARGQREITALEGMESNAVLLPITVEVWRLADRLARKTRLEGYTVPVSDLLIVACARFHGVEIVYRDQHFDLLKRL